MSSSPPEALLLAPGTSADLDGVMDVMRSAFDERFGEAWTRSQCLGILPMSGVTLTVARSGQNGETLGFALARTIAGESELLLLAVAPGARRRGIGGRLLDNFISEAREAGADRLHLEVREGNPAIHMYCAAGFHQAGRRAQYYRGRDGSRFDAITLARTL